MEELVEATGRFLAAYAGRITDVASSKRHNHQHPRPPGDGLLTCLRMDAEFTNSCIFGTGGPFLAEVYPRYRFLRRRLTEFLTFERLLSTELSSTSAVSLVPSVARDSSLGEALPQDSESSRGATILPIGELTRHSKYYARLASQYKIEHCLLTNKKTVVGPDAGILTTACASAQTFGNRLRLMEYGTGAGSTPLMLASFGKLDSYVGNDFSPEVVEFFETTVRSRLVHKGIDCKVVSGSCFELDVVSPLDLIIVGVFYQAQPDLLKLKASAISAALAEGGVLIIQSGKPENPFVTDLLADDPGRHARWPWYEKKSSLKAYFAYTAKVDVHDETMLIASHDRARLDAIVALLRHSPFAWTS